jgi:hypothetical protein
LQRELDQAREKIEIKTDAKPVPSTSRHPVPEVNTANQSIASQAAEGGPEEPALTLVDTDALAVGAEISRFLKGGVSDAVKGAALKKLFADPAYNFISEMDDYVEDYSQMAVLGKAELRNLQQSKDLYLFEDPPWKVEAEANAKAKAELEAGGLKESTLAASDAETGEATEEPDDQCEESIPSAPIDGEPRSIADGPAEVSTNSLASVAPQIADRIDLQKAT